MTGRERVLRTLSRQRADCIPLDIGGSDCSSIHSVAYRRLRRKMGLADGPVRCGCLTQLIAELDEDVKDALGTDAESLCFGSRETKIWHAPFGVDLVVPKLFAVEDRSDGSSIVRDERGGVAGRRSAGACYFVRAIRRWRGSSRPRSWTNSTLCSSDGTTRRPTMSR